jgi:ketosteroid isomerase-like protein
MNCAASALSLFDAWERADYDGVMAHLAPNVKVRDSPRGGDDRTRRSQ